MIVWEGIRPEEKENPGSTSYAHVRSEAAEQCKVLLIYIAASSKCGELEALEGIEKPETDGPP